MKSIIKDIMKRAAIGIGMALTIFGIVGIVFDAKYGGEFHLQNYQFTKMVAGSILVGLGFGVPSVVYSWENVPMAIRILLHMGIGCVVYTLVAWWAGWIGAEASIQRGMIAIALQLSAAFLIWFLFMLHYRKNVKRLNEKIQELKEKPDTCS